MARRCNKPVYQEVVNPAFGSKLTPQNGVVAIEPRPGLPVQRGLRDGTQNSRGNGVGSKWRNRLWRRGGGWETWAVTCAPPITASIAVIGALLKIRPASARGCIMREHGGRTLPFVFKSEDASLVTIARHVEPGSIIHADEASHWDALHARFLTKRINHSEAYSDGEACTNQAESFFSRLRRAEIGIHYHVACPHISVYASELAWRENNHRVSNGEQYLIATDAAPQHPLSRQWKSYWQRSNQA